MSATVVNAALVSSIVHSLTQFAGKAQCGAPGRVAKHDGRESLHWLQRSLDPTSTFYIAHRGRCALGVEHLRLMSFYADLDNLEAVPSAIADGLGRQRVRCSQLRNRSLDHIQSLGRVLTSQEV